MRSIVLTARPRGAATYAKVILGASIPWNSLCHRYYEVSLRSYRRPYLFTAMPTSASRGSQGSVPRQNAYSRPISISLGIGIQIAALLKAGGPSNSLLTEMDCSCNRYQIL